jgi:hypothetical protein
MVRRRTSVVCVLPSPFELAEELRESLRGPFPSTPGTDLLQVDPVAKGDEHCCIEALEIDPMILAAISTSLAASCAPKPFRESTRRSRASGGWHCGSSSTTTYLRPRSPFSFRYARISR